MHANRGDRNRRHNGPDRQEERVFTHVRAALDILVDCFGCSAGKHAPDLRLPIFRWHRWR